VSHFQKRHEFVSVIALLVACAFSTSCTAWHTIGLGATPRDSARSAVLTSSIQRAEVSRVDAVRSIALLAVLGGMAVGVRALIISWANSLGGGN
jgi:hypothetical protein